MSLRNSQRKVQRRSRTRRNFGLLLLFFSLIACLVLGFQLVWTNNTSHKQAEILSKDIRNSWQSDESATTRPLRQGFAFLYIPKLRNQVWSLPISQGTTSLQLDVGLGHYPQTAMPGEVGNFAMAGHRSGHGQPFVNFEELKKGDHVIVETFDKWLVYELAADVQIKPDEVWVLDANPGGLANSLPSKKLITLTTCTPKYGSSGRWAWWGYLLDESPKDQVPKDVQ